MNFAERFKLLTGHSHLPWQKRLYEEHFAKGDFPSVIDIPTGLGKTSIIAIWLIARAQGAKVPSRLVYVVNRRTVVDQTTEEVESYKRKDLPGIPDFAISTLRGQHADNREWCTDPSRPAVICGTVDMIGSRLLFGGYGIGAKARPLHAGFLGQDALLIHDEAHLEPAFQALINAIELEQRRCKEFGKFRVMELTATSRGAQRSFTLDDSDRNDETVKMRIRAKKKLYLEPLKDPESLAEEIVERALQFKDSDSAVLVFVRAVEDVLKIRNALVKAGQQVEVLTGTLRGKERDELVEKPIFQRFMPMSPESAAKGTAYLVCTSAGEVGVNISADHLVCDLSTFESMVQRFGRVNRFGKRKDTEIHILYPKGEFNQNNDYERRRKLTLDLLKELDGDACPDLLGKLDAEKRLAAFAPEPVLLPTSDILFDAWALTTIRGELPGRPPVEPYLHGLPTEWQPPETYVAWREEVDKITGELRERYKPEMLLDVYPLRPHELLREPSYRVFKHFQNLVKIHRERAIPVWLLDDDGSVDVITLAELADSKNKDNLNWKTVILPPSAGGLEGGMLNGSSLSADDVADTDERKRIWGDDPEPEGMRRIITVEFADPDDEDEVSEKWHWYEKANEGTKSAKLPVIWGVHVEDVERETARIVDALPLSDDLKRAVKLAAKFHDHGKLRELFQRVLGNAEYPNILLAKSGNKKGARLQETYRHEFGSLLDIEQEDLGEWSDLVLHLIAAHHGRARPHFLVEEVFDPERPQADAERIAAEVPRRFARLQWRYGRWGLAYLESLLRAADWAASSNPSRYWQGGQ